MPFNVCDGEGRHLGFVVGVYRDQLLVALSDSRLSLESFDWDKVNAFAAERLFSTGFMGKVDGQKLEMELRALWEQKEIVAYNNEFDRTHMLRRILLKNHPNPGENFTLPQAIGGYILMKRNEHEFMYDDCIVLREALDYCQSIEPRLDAPPLMTKIIDYPVIERTNEMIPQAGLFGPEYFNKFVTRLKLRSGNVELDLGFTMPIHCSLGSPFYIYLKEGKVQSVVCNGIRYDFLD